MAYVPTLKTQYKEQIIAALMKEFEHVRPNPKDMPKFPVYIAMHR